MLAAFANVDMHGGRAVPQVTLGLVASPARYYDGVKFHRSIRNFMVRRLAGSFAHTAFLQPRSRCWQIQGGDPTGTGRGGQFLAVGVGSFESAEIAAVADTLTCEHAAFLGCLCAQVSAPGFTPRARVFRQVLAMCTGTGQAAQVGAVTGTNAGDKTYDVDL